MKLYLLLLIVLGTFSSTLFSLPVEIDKRLSINIGNMIDSVIENAIPRSYKTNNVAYAKGKLLDIYHGDEIDTEELKPVNIFIFGGAFVIGSKALNTGIGEYLMDRGNGHVAVVPNYVLFPNGDMEDMIEDVFNSIVWVKENIKQYGGDPENINILAHSAGAHLVSMVLLKSGLDIINNRKVMELPEGTIKSVVLLNGIYDFDEYVYKGDIEELSGGSTVFEKLLKLFLGTCKISPTDILRKENNSTLTIQPTKLTVIHTSEDTTVPPHSSLAFYNHLVRTLINPKIVSYKVVEGNHNTITGAMFDNDPFVTELLEDKLY